MALRKIVGVPDDIAAHLPPVMLAAAVERIEARRKERTNLKRIRAKGKRRRRMPLVSMRPPKDIPARFDTAVKQVRRYQHVIDALDAEDRRRRRSRAGRKRTVPTFALFVAAQMSANWTARSRGMVVDVALWMNWLDDEQRLSIGVVDWREGEDHEMAMYHRLWRRKDNVVKLLDKPFTAVVNGKRTFCDRKWFLTEVARAGVPADTVLTLAAAIDATDVPTPARRRWRKADAPKGPDGFERVTNDLDARLGHRSAANGRPVPDIFPGLHLDLITQTAKTIDGQYAPGYVLAAALEPANPSHTTLTLELLDHLASVGIPINDLTVDRGYYGPTFAANLRERRVSLHTHLKEGDDIAHGAQDGIVYIANVPYDNRVPLEWRYIQPPHFTAPAIEHAKYEVFCDVRWKLYGCRRMTKPDKNGHTRWRTPIGDKRAWSRSMPQTHHLMGEYEEVVLAPGEKPVKTITTEADDLPLLQQYVPYGRDHGRAMARRSKAEAANSLLKGHHARGIGDRRWHLVQGASNLAFFLAPALCALNDHLAQVDRHRREHPPPPTTGDPPPTAEAA